MGRREAAESQAARQAVVVRVGKAKRGGGRWDVPL